MAKNSRGKLLYKTPSRARGTCPICLATRIKLLETLKKTDGTSVKVCKRCLHAPIEKVDRVDPNRIYSFRRSNAKAFHALKSQSL